MGRDDYYNNRFQGKFMVFAKKNDPNLDEKDLEGHFSPNADFHFCPYIEFDKNFPLQIDMEHIKEFNENEIIEYKKK